MRKDIDSVIKSGNCIIVNGKLVMTRWYPYLVGFEGSLKIAETLVCDD